MYDTFEGLSRLESDWRSGKISADNFGADYDASESQAETMARAEIGQAPSLPIRTLTPGA